jgi:hypothetical protein
MKKYALLAGIAALPLLAAVSTSTSANATILPRECIAAPGKVIASPTCLRLIYSDDMLSRGISGVSINVPAEPPAVDGGTRPVVTPPSSGGVPIDNPGRDVDNGDDEGPGVIDDPKKDDPKKDDPKKDDPKKDEPKKDDEKGYGDKTWNPHTGWDDTKEWTEHDQLYHDAVKGKDKKKDEVIAEEPKKDEPKKDEPKKGEPKKGYGEKKEAPVVDKKGDKKETPVVDKKDKKKDAPSTDKKKDKKDSETPA